MSFATTSSCILYRQPRYVTGQVTPSNAISRQRYAAGHQVFPWPRNLSRSLPACSFWVHGINRLVVFRRVRKAHEYDRFFHDAIQPRPSLRSADHQICSSVSVFHIRDKRSTNTPGLLAAASSARSRKGLPVCQISLTRFCQTN